MLDINLNDKKYLEGFEKELKALIVEDSLSRAESFYFYLSKILAIPEINQQLSKEILNRYNRMITIAKMIALPRLSENEIYKILTKHLSYILDIEGYDIWRKIKIYLLNLTSLEERDNFKEGIRKILLNNEAIITDKNIILNNKEAAPTVSNWLMDFRSLYGEAGFLDPIKLSNYLTNSKNIKNLTLIERNKINSLFSLYKKLKISSLTLEGLEEDITIIKPDGEMGIIKQGQYEKIGIEEVELSKTARQALESKDKNGINKGKINEATINEFKIMLNKYPVGSLERKAIEEEMEKQKSHNA